MLSLVMFLDSSATAVDESLISERLNLDSLDEIQDVYNRVIRSSKSEDKLASLACHDNTSIAMRASWERAIRKAEPHEGKASRWRELRYKTSSAEFLAFVEGRLRVPVPRFFSDAIVNVDPTKRFGLLFRPDLYLPTRDLGNGIMVDEKAQSQLVDEGKALKIGPASLETTIPLTMLRFPNVVGPKNDYSKTGLSVLITKDVACAACYELTGFSYDVICVDRISKKILWRNEVWARAFGGVAGDGLLHVTKLAEANGSVYVFGMTHDIIYIEGFDLKSGAAVLRFSNYW